MSNDTSGAVASNAELGLLSRLRSLKVLLGTDSPEVRGWAPAVRHQAEKTINAALVGFSDLNATLANLESTTLKVANENERMRLMLQEASELFRFYEKSHLAKGAGHEEKAQRNADIAARIESVLAPNTGNERL